MSALTVAAYGAEYDLAEGVDDIDFAYLAANEGNLDHISLYNLSYGHITGDVTKDGIEANPQKAIELSELSFELSGKSYAPPLNLLGLCHYLGLGTDINIVRAFGLFTRSHNMRHNYATLNLGVMHLEGSIENSSPTEAFSLLSQAHENDPEEPIIAFDLGLVYNRGVGTEKSVPQAVELFEIASKQDHVSAKAELAHIYAQGLLGERDTVKALELYSELSDADHPYGHFGIGLASLYGIAIPQNIERGISILKHAAEMGSHHAQYELAQQFRTEKFVKKSPEEYTRYLELACAQGNPDALAEREYLSSYLFENIEDVLSDFEPKPIGDERMPVERDIDTEPKKPPAVGRNAKRTERSNVGKLKQVKVSLPPDLAEHLRAAADARGVSFSRQISDIVTGIEQPISENDPSP